ncbi:hypothetical protein B0H11DRAFT_834860 [Mycena galericulata]|nr:hypothetical protein B0H11DRAFT_834860 [Mycena galericulata]
MIMSGTSKEQMLDNILLVDVESKNASVTVCHCHFWPLLHKKAMNGHASPCPRCGAVRTSPDGETFDPHVVPQSGSPHHRLLNSNEPPEAPVVPFIHSVLLRIGTHLACLDDEISSLRAQLELLEKGRASLSDYHMQNKGIVSPLRRMPPEVLGEIFSWTLLSVEEAWSCDRFKKSPWVLTHICSRWRSISLATPSLWSQVIINYHQGFVPPLAAIETQIERAHTLTIHFFPTSNQDPGPQLEMFELLAKHSLRWEVLCLGITRAMLPALTVLRHRVPLLRRLWIQSSDEGNDEAFLDSVDCFFTAPSLVDVGVFDPYFSVSIPMPVHQLTRYELEGSLDMHLHLLGLAENLIEARIDVDISRDTLSQSVVHLSLRRLYVSNTALLDYITAPALEELGMWVTKKSSPHLAPFIDRSSCPLRRLCLRGSPRSREATEILSKGSSITELVIISVHDYAEDAADALMSTLTVSDLTQNTVLAPQLQCIFVGCEHETAMHYMKYVEMLESRWKSPGYALTAGALIIEDGLRPDSTTLSRLNSLRQSGLDLLLLEGSAALVVLQGWAYQTASS